MLACNVLCLELVDTSWLCGCVSPTSALRHRLPCMLHPDLTTHTHTLYHAALHVHIGMCFTWLHARERSNTYRTSVHKNTHMHSLFQTLAVGMALCTNTPTFTHPFNLRAQKPRVTTSLSAVKPRNYDKPLSMFILPLLTMHYPHHPPLPSNLRWSHFWITWLITLRSQARRHTITKHVGVLYRSWVLLGAGSPRLYGESHCESL